MPKNNKVTGQRWRECDRCSLDYPLSQLQKQDGFRLCKEHCTDDIGRDYYLKQLDTEGELRGSEQEESKTETFSDGD